MTTISLPTLALPILADNNLSRYIGEISKFPLLEKEEEIELANRWIHHEDIKAAHKLVTSHLRLVVKIASGFRGYGLPAAELVAEGNIGLMHAVKRFDPEKGFRLSTYAMWWIKASINEYILRSWSLVKMGTTAAQKKIFFNLRRMKNRITAASGRNLLPAEVSKIAHELAVPERDVIEMDQRMSATDRSLNQVIGEDSEAEWIDFVEDDSVSYELIMAENQELFHRKKLLKSALENLNDRERDIIQKRCLSETPATLEVLSKLYNISRERIRQIESCAMEKLQTFVAKAENA